MKISESGLDHRFFDDKYLMQVPVSCSERIIILLPQLMALTILNGI